MLWEGRFLMKNSKLALIVIQSPNRYSINTSGIIIKWKDLIFSYLRW